MRKVAGARYKSWAVEVVGAETGIRAFGTKFDIVSEGTKVLRGDKIKILNERRAIGYGVGHPNWEVEVVGAKMGVRPLRMKLTFRCASEVRRTRLFRGDERDLLTGMRAIMCDYEW